MTTALAGNSNKPPINSDAQLSQREIFHKEMSRGMFFFAYVQGALFGENFLGLILQGANLMSGDIWRMSKGFHSREIFLKGNFSPGKTSTENFPGVVWITSLYV